MTLSPDDQTTLGTLINDMDSGYQSSIDSSNSLNDEKEKLEKQIDLVTSLKNQYESSYPNLSKLLDYHLNQKAGPGGTFGLKAQLKSVEKMAKAADKNLKVQEVLSRVYTSIYNDSDTPVIDEDLLNELEESATEADNEPDFIYKNREEFPEKPVNEETNEEEEWPIGATCVVNGVLYIYAGVEWTVWKYHDNDTGWERVAFQDSDEQITAPGA